MIRFLFSGGIVFFLTVIGFGAGMIWAKNQQTEPVYEATFFTTVLSADTNSSVEEKETASHFFAEAILGWTLSPYFTETLGFPVSSKKQERGNIIFQFSSPSHTQTEAYSKKLESLLSAKLSQYNTSSNTQFILLSDPVQIQPKTVKQSMWSIIGAGLGFFGGLMLLEGIRFIRRSQHDKH